MEKREEFKNNLNSPAAEEFTNPDDPSMSAFSNSNINSSNNNPLDKKVSLK
jgi:hypothetical protein